MRDGNRTRCAAGHVVMHTDDATFTYQLANVGPRFKLRFPRSQKSPALSY